VIDELGRGPRIPGLPFSYAREIVCPSIVVPIGGGIAAITVPVYVNVPEPSGSGSPFTLHS